MIEKDKVTENGITVIQSLLKDENCSVRIAVIERVKLLHEVLGEENTKKYLIPMLEGCFNDKKWRFRLSIAEKSLGLFESLNYDDYKEFIDKLLNTFIKDHYFSIREQIINCIVKLKSVCGT